MTCTISDVLRSPAKEYLPGVIITEAELDSFVRMAIFVSGYEVLAMLG